MKVQLVIAFACGLTAASCTTSSPSLTLGPWQSRGWELLARAQASAGNPSLDISCPYHSSDLDCRKALSAVDLSKLTLVIGSQTDERGRYYRYELDYGYGSTKVTIYYGPSDRLADAPILHVILEEYITTA